MEHFNGPDGVEFGRRVLIQGHCLLCVCAVLLLASLPQTMTRIRA
jgi:hypothetical protein